MNKGRVKRAVKKRCKDQCRFYTLAALNILVLDPTTWELDGNVLK